MIKNIKVLKFNSLNWYEILLLNGYLLFSIL